jgi:DNA-directed RNA polymerase specialized sigma24 family protein
VTLLAGKLVLGDVHDVEALCRSILNRELAERSAYMTEDDEQDALSHLFEHVVLLWQGFDSQRNTSFAGYVSAYLKLRLSDWYRSRFGRAGGRMLPVGSWSLDDDGRQEHDALAVMDDPEVSGLLDVLSNGMRRIVLARIEGVPRAELARRLGVSQKTAAQRELWALQELRVHYPDWAWPVVGVATSDEREAVAA